MIDHIGIRVTDLGKSIEFYTRALAPLGYTLLRKMEEHGVAGFGVGQKPDFWIHTDPRVTTKPEGIHVGFATPRRSLVKEFYAAAMAAGGTDNGAPGPRPMYHEHYYAGFVRDPDGHNIEVVCHEAYLG
ncbi:MAG: VOC family protein [Proteobacteria bacterium]|nr:VOC family protein [Pseudomonadota bacterium]